MKMRESESGKKRAGDTCANVYIYTCSVVRGL